MSKTKDIPEIKIGKFKPVRYYEADFTGPDDIMKTITDIGRKVVTDDQLFNIGVNHILTNAVDGQFEINSIKKKKKK